MRISKPAHGQKKYQRVTVYRLQTSEKTAWKSRTEDAMFDSSDMPECPYHQMPDFPHRRFCAAVTEAQRRV